MSLNTKIEWTEATWNPVTGCSKVSAGCEHCYAERLSLRLQAMGNHNYSRGFEVTCHPHMLEKPLHWRRPHSIFVNSMSDLFHEEVSSAFILRVFETMLRAHWHRFQVLTKRSERMAELAAHLPLADHIWIGATVEDQDCLSRVADLMHVPAAIRFLSLEPLLSPLVDLPLAGIDWVIVGGESGPGARPMDPEWVLDIRDRCVQNGVPFFFKQWGGTNKKRTGRLLEGRTWDEMPNGCATPPATSIQEAVAIPRGTRVAR